MNRRSLLLAGGMAVTGLAGVWMVRGGQSTSSLPTLGAANVQTATVDTSAVVEMELGAPDAPVTVMEYASFTCPHCATFHATVLPALKTGYIDTGKVRFIYRDVYFDRFGLWASLVARCEPTRFFGLTELIYSQQREWFGNGDPATVAENLKKIGRVAGLDNAQLDACFADQAKAEALVAWFQTNAEADGIDSTPSLVIDGEKFSNMPYAELKTILDKKLAP
jgi:protein-disulfide isomerase